MSSIFDIKRKSKNQKEPSKNWPKKLKISSFFEVVYGGDLETGLNWSFLDDIEHYSQITRNEQVLDWTEDQLITPTMATIGGKIQ